MVAIIATDGHFAFAELSRPSRKTASEVLVKVERISLNRGELAFPWASGSAAGWDAYGTVVETSDDGAGPLVGSRVATWSFSGAWAQYRVVDRANLAIVPDSITTLVAAALPVVGLTALRGLRQLKLEQSQSIAITGASGGVGHLAIQLAVLAGLRITAVVRDDRAKSWLQTNGINIDAIIGLENIDATGPYDAVIDTVGGLVLEKLLPKVRDEGTVLLVGNASGEKTSLDIASLVSRRVDLLTYKDYSTAGADLRYLLDCVANNSIAVHASDGGDWKRLITEHPEQLLKRGKITFSV